jgi:hypothetical protein
MTLFCEHGNGISLSAIELSDWLSNSQLLKAMLTPSKEQFYLLGYNAMYFV